MRRKLGERSELSNCVCLRLTLHLKNPNPVTAAPLVVRGQGVMALHFGLGEVNLPHITKHHAGLFIHGLRKTLCENSLRICSRAADER